MAIAAPLTHDFECYAEIFVAGVRLAMICIMVRRFATASDRLLSAHRKVSGDLCGCHALDLRRGEASSLCRVHVVDCPGCQIVDLSDRQPGNLRRLKSAGFR